MKEKQVPMMKTNAAVAELNKVAGFDPVKLLNSALSKSSTMHRLPPLRSG